MILEPWASQEASKMFLFGHLIFLPLVGLKASVLLVDTEKQFPVLVHACPFLRSTSLTAQCLENLPKQPNTKPSLGQFQQQQ